VVTEYGENINMGQYHIS